MSYYSEKMPSETLEGVFDQYNASRVVQINNALKELKAPFYIVCSVKRDKRSQKLLQSWKRVGITCDTKYPNIRSVSKNTVARWLMKNLKISLYSLMQNPSKVLDKFNGRIQTAAGKPEKVIATRLTKKEKIALEAARKAEEKAARKLKIEERKAESQRKRVALLEKRKKQASERKEKLDAQKAADKAKSEAKKQSEVVKAAENAVEKAEVKVEKIEKKMKKPFAKSKSNKKYDSQSDFERYEKNNRSELKSFYSAAKRSGELKKGSDYRDFAYGKYRASIKPIEAPKPVETKSSGKPSMMELMKQMMED